MVGCYSQLLTEVLRLVLTAENAGQLVSIRLTPAPNPANRARAAARFCMSVSLEWAPEPWVSGVALIDQRGYPLEWTVEQVGKWMVKSLAGDGIAVMLDIPQAASIPANWTQARVTASYQKVRGMSPSVVRADAAAKSASVAAWAPGARRTAVLEAAARMNTAAALIEQVKGVQDGLGFTEWTAGNGDAMPPAPSPAPAPTPAPAPQ